MKQSTYFQKLDSLEKKLFVQEIIDLLLASETFCFIVSRLLNRKERFVESKPKLVEKTLNAA